MKTFEERRAFFNEIVQHPNIEFKEIFKTTYIWWRFESNLRARVRAQKNLEKYGKRIDEQVEVLGLRAEMQDL